MQSIFPKEIIETTVQSHHYKHHTTSKIIYIVLIVSFLATIFASPFLYIDLYSTGPGMLRPDMETNTVSSLYSGKIKKTYVIENSRVEKGDTLIILDYSDVNENLNLLKFKIENSSIHLHDLKYLTSNKNVIQDSIHSIKYQNKYKQNVENIKEHLTHLTKSKDDFNRQNFLYKKEVISKAELDNSKYELDIARNNLALFREKTRNEWQFELDQQIEKYDELVKSAKLFKTEYENHFIKAPISGTIQKSEGFEPGNFISNGRPIAEISPNTKLIAECYMDPSSIGLIKKSGKVNFQIHAFNHHEWGMLTGNVFSIHDDISIVNNLPKFKVKCSIDKDYLKLSNGFTGKLRKGMTFNAHFYLIERSIFDLLFDKIENWILPINIDK